MQTRVVIYVPPDVGFGERYRAECAAHCARRGGVIVSVARSPHDVWATLDAGEADRIVVARAVHAAQLVRDAVEVASDGRVGPLPRQRRPPPEMSAGRPWV